MVCWTRRRSHKGPRSTMFVLHWYLPTLGIITNGVRGIYFRGQSYFSQFCSQHEMLFAGRNFHFLEGPNKFQRFQKSDKKKKKKKRRGSSVHFKLVFFLFHFRFSTFPFAMFCLCFSVFLFFLASLFPVGQQKFLGKECQGGTLLLLPPAPLPRLLRHLLLL